MTALHGATAVWVSGPRPLRPSATTDTASRYSRNMLCLPFTLPAAGETEGTRRLGAFCCRGQHCGDMGLGAARGRAELSRMMSFSVGRTPGLQACCSSMAVGFSPGKPRSKVKFGEQLEDL